MYRSASRPLAVLANGGGKLGTGALNLKNARGNGLHLESIENQHAARQSVLPVTPRDVVWNVSRGLDGGPSGAIPGIRGWYDEARLVVNGPKHQLTSAASVELLCNYARGMSLAVGPDAPLRPRAELAEVARSSFPRGITTSRDPHRPAVLTVPALDAIDEVAMHDPRTQPMQPPSPGDAGAVVRGFIPAGWLAALMATAIP